MAALVMGVCFVACNEDPDVNGPSTEQPGDKVEASVKVEVIEVNPGGARIEVTTTNIKQFAYLKSDNAVAEESVLFVTGAIKNIDEPEKETVTRLEILGVGENTAASVYFAFIQSNDEYYGEVVEASFKTTNYEGVLTVIDRRYDGFGVYIKMPEEVKARGNALRYSTSSLPMYNYKKSEGALELDMLLYNAQQFTTTDKAVRYDEEHSYELDDEGNPIPDGAAYSDPKVPGEPGVFLIGEYALMENTEEMLVYMDLTDDGVDNPCATSVNAVESDPLYLDYLSSAIWWYPAGWDPGYYMPKYDFDAWVADLQTGGRNIDTEKYWTGYYKRIQVDTIEPDTFDGGVKMGTHSMKPIEGCVTFEPTDNVVFYNVMIMEESEFQTQVLPLLDNNTDYLRWFTGSYFGLYTFGSMMLYGDSEIYLSDWFTDMKTMQGKKIRVLCTAMGDEEGKTQVYQDFTFDIPTADKPAPVIVVTPVESDDPFTATFNIKAPNKDVHEAYFACDYVREFNIALKETTYLALMRTMGAGNKFGKNEITMINSAAGLNFTVASRADATTRLAVIAYNDEGTHNADLNDADPQAIAEYTTPRENFPVPVTSDLFEALCGEWEASAQMAEYDEDAKEFKLNGKTFTSKVEICSGIEYPETLPQEAYDIYAKIGYDKDATDVLYEEFVDMAEYYNRRTRGFNRLLCLGYNLTSPEYMLDLLATPYELFTMTDYSSSTTNDLFYDFGPKWNLEIDEDGKVWLPIDITKEYPLSTWNFGLEYTFYILGVGQKSYIGAPVYAENGSLLCDSRFPVEVSADRNTITIKPIEYEYKTTSGTTATEVYYPCVAQLQYGQATPTSPRVQSDVVLKRKSSASASSQNVSTGVSTPAPKVKSIGNAPVPMQRHQGITPVRAIKVKEFKRVIPETKIESGVDAFKRRADELVYRTCGVRIER